MSQSEGQQAFDAGKYEVAIAKWEEVLTLSPDAPGVKKSIEAARRRIQEEAVRRGKIERLISEGKQAFDAGEDELAIAKWKEVLAFSPEEPGVNEYIAAAQQAMKREAARQQREESQRRKEQEKQERRIRETEEKQRRQEEGTARTRAESFLAFAKKAEEKQRQQEEQERRRKTKPEEQKQQSNVKDRAYNDASRFAAIRLPTINIALYAQTDLGMVAENNEDSFLILDLSTGRSWTKSEEEPRDLLTYSQGYYGSLLAVSDGMVNRLAGEVASRMAVETVCDRMLQLQAHDVYGKMPFHERLRLSIEEANILINAEGQTNPAHKGLGATFTAVATFGSQVYFGQVGDSRAYLIRRDKIYRITKDQSLVRELIYAGQITEEEAETHSQRNVLLRVLGAHSNVNVEINSLTLCDLDTLVLCSHGLSDKMNQEEIAHIVYEAADFKSACQRLIDLANDRGGEDNITVVIAQFSGSGLFPPGGESIEPNVLVRSADTPKEINWDLSAAAAPPSKIEEPPKQRPQHHPRSDQIPFTKASSIAKAADEDSDRSYYVFSPALESRFPTIQGNKMVFTMVCLLLITAIIFVLLELFKLFKLITSLFE